MFPRRFYIELQRAGLADNEAHVRAAVPLAARAEAAGGGHASGAVRCTRDDFEAHEARVCIAEGETLANPRRIKRFTREQYFKTQAQMAGAVRRRAFGRGQHACEIAQRCNLQLDAGQAAAAGLPDARTASPIDEYFRRASHEGLERAAAGAVSRMRPSATQQRPRYVERLEFEIDTILKMGFPGYFLIVGRLHQLGQANNGCPVGPGRGSGAGSLVAYALWITDLDPLHYNLLFERFLNPERVSMPDFDIDFCQANRDRVIDYVKDKYGRDAVSQIATFGTMAAKAALRDVGRVLGMGYGHVDGIAKLIPAPPGKHGDARRGAREARPRLIYARKEAPELDQREAPRKKWPSCWRWRRSVEGMARNVGMHAGGVLIAPGKHHRLLPAVPAAGQRLGGEPVRQGRRRGHRPGEVRLPRPGHADDPGAGQGLHRRAPSGQRATSRYETLPLDDPAVYKLFSDGKTEAVFQFESRGMQGMLRDAKPNRLEDLIALNALFRPGPMDHIPTFCARKHGREPVAYPHPLLEPVLGETYGIMVYQEQVMQAAQVLGGYSLGGADMLRRAMGKKKPEEMAKQREIFRDGAAQQGHRGRARPTRSST